MTRERERARACNNKQDDGGAAADNATSTKKKKENAQHTIIRSREHVDQCAMLQPSFRGADV